jgi:hypothetical protein
MKIVLEQPVKNRIFGASNISGGGGSNISNIPWEIFCHHARFGPNVL